MTLTKDSRQAAHELCVILSELNFNNGQQALVTPDSFARPNFGLVCQILAWLLTILDPQDSSHHKSPEMLRCDKYRANDVPEVLHVEHLKSLGRKFHKQLGVHLNLLALYRADLTSCPELLKVAEPVFRAAKLVVGERSRFLKEPGRAKDELEASRLRMERLASHLDKPSDLGDQGRGLSQLVGELERILSDEDKWQRERAKAIDGKLEMRDLERVLGAATLRSMGEATERLRRQNEELQLDLARLEEKLAGKERELSEATAKANELVLIQSPAYRAKEGQLRADYEAAYARFVSSYRTLTHVKSCVYSHPAGDGDDDDDEDGDDESESDEQDELAELEGCESLFGAQRLAKPSTEDEAAATLEASGPAAPLERLLAETELDSDDEGTELLLVGDEMTGPARLLESLFEAAGMSNPMSASLTTAGPRAPAEVGVGQALVGAATGGAVGAGGASSGAGGAGRGRTTPGAGLRYAGRNAGLELDSLLDEFGAFDGPTPEGLGALPAELGAPAGRDEDELGNDDDDDDHDDEGDDDDDVDDDDDDELGHE